MIMVRRVRPAFVRTIWETRVKPIPNGHDNLLFYR